MNEQAKLEAYVTQAGIMRSGEGIVHDITESHRLLRKRNAECMGTIAEWAARVRRLGKLNGITDPAYGVDAVSTILDTLVERAGAIPALDDDHALINELISRGYVVSDETTARENDCRINAVQRQLAKWGAPVDVGDNPVDVLIHEHERLAHKVTK